MYTCRTCSQLCFEAHCLYDNVWDSHRLADLVFQTVQIRMTRDDGLPQNLCADCTKKITSFYLFKLNCQRSNCGLRDKSQARCTNSKSAEIYGAPSEYINSISGEECIAIEIENADVKPEVLNYNENNFDQNCVNQLNEYCNLYTPQSQSTLNHNSAAAKVAETFNEMSANNIEEPMILLIEGKKADQCNEQTMQQTIAKIEEIEIEETIIQSSAHFTENDIEFANSLETTEAACQLETENILSQPVEDNIENSYAQATEMNAEVFRLEHNDETSFITLREMRVVPFIEDAFAVATPKVPKSKKKPKKAIKKKQSLKNEPRTIEMCTKTAQALSKSGNHFPCELCNKVFSTRGKLIYHRSKVFCTKTPFKCLKCCWYFITAENLKKHELSMPFCHSLQCSKCNVRFSSGTQLSRHNTRYHNKRNQCGVCKKIFPTHAELQNHENGRLHQAGFMCTLCDQIFCSNIDLVNHKRYHHKKSIDSTSASAKAI